MDKAYTFKDLTDITAKLRSENGCTWDRAQTHESLIPCLMEESGEVRDAIVNKDDENLCEELGDLLFQVMLELGVLPSSTIVEAEIDGKKVFDVADGFLLACFDSGVTTETVTAIAKQQPYYAVFRDASIADDSTATNFDQIFETYSPSTVRKVL